MTYYDILLDNMTYEARLGGDGYQTLDVVARTCMHQLVDNAIWIPMPKPKSLFGRINIVGWGGDLCYIPDMEDTMRDSPSLIDRIFSPNEILYSFTQSRPGAHLAARYAAKESGYKASGIAYRDLVVVHKDGRHPAVILEGESEERFTRLGIRPHLVTLSHDGDYALAFLAIVEARFDQKGLLTSLFSNDILAAVLRPLLNKLYGS